MTIKLESIIPIAAARLVWMIAFTFASLDARSDVVGVGLEADVLEGVDGNEPVKVPLQSAIPSWTSSFPARTK